MATPKKVATRPPSMVDVAALIGVSHQTVSRVINNNPSVKNETRVKVLAALDELGYRPNRLAKALKTGLNSTIGVLSHDTTLHGPASVLHAVQAAGRENGYAISLISLKSVYPAAVMAGLEELADLGAGGVVIIAPQSSEYAVLTRIPRNIPAVIIEGEDVTSIPSVEVDQFNGARIAVEHLINLGHKQIAHISGPKEWFSAQRRLDGWKDALTTAKLPSTTLVEGDWSPRSGYLATLDILKNHPKTTAIFSANDDMALGAYKALAEMNIFIPGNMSIVGFDDTPASAFLSPGLTTIRQDFDQVGTMALRMLLKMIRGEKVAIKKQLIDPDLIIRGSTSKPSKR